MAQRKDWKMKNISLWIRKYVSFFDNDIHNNVNLNHFFENYPIAALGIIDHENVTWDTYVDDLRKHFHLKLPYNAAVITFENDKTETHIITHDNIHSFYGNIYNHWIRMFMFNVSVPKEVEYEFMLFCLNNLHLNKNLKTFWRNFKMNSLKETLSEIFIYDQQEIAPISKEIG
jgi:hypothetical protein